MELKLNTQGRMKVTRLDLHIIWTHQRRIRHTKSTVLRKLTRKDHKNRKKWYYQWPVTNREAFPLHFLFGSTSAAANKFETWRLELIYSRWRQVLSENPSWNIRWVDLVYWPCFHFGAFARALLMFFNYEREVLFHRK
jgi:hypothetical protein